VKIPSTANICATKKQELQLIWLWHFVVVLVVHDLAKSKMCEGSSIFKFCCNRRSWLACF